MTVADTDPFVALADAYALALRDGTDFDGEPSSPGDRDAIDVARAALVAALDELRGELADLRRACRLGVPRPEAWQAMDAECLLFVRARDAARIHAALGSPDRPDGP